MKVWICFCPLQTQLLFVYPALGRFSDQSQRHIRQVSISVVLREVDSSMLYSTCEDDTSAYLNDFAKVSKVAVVGNALDKLKEITVGLAMCMLKSSQTRKIAKHVMIDGWLSFKANSFFYKKSVCASTLIPAPA